MLGGLRSLKKLTKGLFHSQPQEKAWHDDEDDGIECDCGHGSSRTDLKAAKDVVSSSPIGEGSGC